MKTLFILCGVPGSGKSTWASKQFGEENVVSRDKIRFSFLDNESDYFDKETCVWEEFIREIQNRLNGDEKIVVADATHINKRSRNKLLNALKLSNEVNVIPIFFDICQAVCMERNSKREGRAYVPKSVIRRMGYQFEIPRFEESARYTEIWRVDAQNNLEKFVRK